MVAFICIKNSEEKGTRGAKGVQVYTGSKFLIPLNSSLSPNSHSNVLTNPSRLASLNLPPPRGSN